MPVLEDLFGSLFGGFSRGVPPLVTEVLLPWANKVGLSAIARWSPIVASHIRCGLPYKMGSPHLCSNQAIAGCGCCKSPVCLDHAMVAGNADVICLRCVNETVKIIQERIAKDPDRQPPRSRPMADESPDREAEKLKHLKTLGLDPDDEPGLDEIKAAYRKLVAKHHPDRAPEAERKAATKRFLKIQAAYEFLVDDAERKVA